MRWRQSEDTWGGSTFFIFISYRRIAHIYCRQPQISQTHSHTHTYTRRVLRRQKGHSALTGQHTLTAVRLNTHTHTHTHTPISMRYTPHAWGDLSGGIGSRWESLSLSPSLPRSTSPTILLSHISRISHRAIEAYISTGRGDGTHWRITSVHMVRYPFPRKELKEGVQVGFPTWAVKHVGTLKTELLSRVEWCVCVCLFRYVWWWYFGTL